MYEALFDVILEWNKIMGCTFDFDCATLECSQTIHKNIQKWANIQFCEVTISVLKLSEESSLRKLLSQPRKNKTGWFVRGVLFRN